MKMQPLTQEQKQEMSDTIDKWAEIARANNKIAIPKLSSGTLGAIGELLIGIDLLSRGYEVHRALSPNAKYDLIALKDDEILKIQVKTGRYDNTKVIYNRDKGTTPTHYAVVTTTDSKLHYFPSLDELL